MKKRNLRIRRLESAHSLFLFIIHKKAHNERGETGTAPEPYQNLIASSTQFDNFKQLPVQPLRTRSGDRWRLGNSNAHRRLPR